MKYKITEFLDEVGDNCSYIVFLSVRHILNKVYEDVENAYVKDKEELIDIIEDYSFVLRYLNDFAGTIYRKYDTSIDAIYLELCNQYNLSTDNKYTYEHIVKKLQKQTPILLMSLADEDIKIQTIENFCEKLDEIKKSKYYLANIDDLSFTIKELQKNIDFVKMASRM